MRGGGRGMMMKFERLQTSSSRLSISWDSSGVTKSVQIKDAGHALRHLADDDRRPLLILRMTHDTGKATKKVRQLLKAALASERFKLTSKWFHCVELSKEVLEKDHPYHVLFQGKRPPRMLLASPDGKKMVPFLGTQKQRVNWLDIVSVLKTTYAKDPTQAIRGLERLLNTFDVQDSKFSNLGTQIAIAAEKNQTTKVEALKAKLKKLEAERAKSLEQEKAFRNLGLKAAKKKDDDEDGV